MDKLIEALLSKKFVTTMVGFLLVVIFLPATFLVFIWNRQMFYELDLMKLLLVITGMSAVCFLINCILFSFLMDIYLKFKIEILHGEKKDKSSSNGDLLSTCLIAIFMEGVELIILACYKIININTNMNDIVNMGIVVGKDLVKVVAIIYVFVLVVAYFRTKRNKKNT